MVSWNFTTHATYPLALTTYKYSELQVSGAIQKLSYKANCKTPIFFILCYNHLHLCPYILTKVLIKILAWTFFKMATNINELVKELVNQKLLIFRRFQMNVKDIKCHCQWFEKHEFMFPIIRFLAYQILSIIGSQIGIKRIFFFGDNVL
jgi:hypothetical protein